jgi:hypothetical protein
VEGYGATPQKAKSNALSSLSQFFESKIDSRVESAIKVTNDHVDEKLENQLKVVSKSFLKGVNYGKVTKQGDSYTVKAHITKSSMKETIRFLHDEVANLQYDKLSQTQMREKLEKVSFLKSMSSFIGNKRFIFDAKQSESELLKYLNQSRVSFDVDPKQALITVNGKQYKSHEYFFLIPGEYNFRVEYQGFRSEENNFYVSKGQRLNKHVELVPLSVGNVRMVLQANNSDLLAAAKKVLLDQNIEVSRNNEGQYAMYFQLTKKKTVEIDGMQFFNMKASVSLKEGSREVIMKKAVLKNKTEAYLNNKMSILGKKLTQAVLKKYQLKSGLQSNSYDRH